MCRGQRHDGTICCSTMPSAVKRHQGRYKRVAPLATYYHCASHQLILCLSKAATGPELHSIVCKLVSWTIFQILCYSRRALEIAVNSINEIRQSANRDRIVKTKLKECVFSISNHCDIFISATCVILLQSQCNTRWVDRHTTLHELDEIYETLLLCLQLLLCLLLFFKPTITCLASQSLLVSNCKDPARIFSKDIVHLKW